MTITIIVILTCSNLRNAFPTHGDQDIPLRTKQPKYGFSKNSIAQNPVSNPFDFETKTNAIYALKYTCESFQIRKLICIAHMLYKEGIIMYTHSTLVPSIHIYNSISFI